ncbi:MAG: hypothetical protein ACTSRU_03290, partial [Candidatus Hodarchaeales archaeon]
GAIRSPALEEMKDRLVFLPNEVLKRLQQENPAFWSIKNRKISEESLDMIAGLDKIDASTTKIEKKLSKKSVTVLKVFCKDLGLKKYSKLKKQQVIGLLTSTQDEETLLSLLDKEQEKKVARTREKMKNVKIPEILWNKLVVQARREKIKIDELASRIIREGL